MTRHVLVPVDGSSQSEQAFEYVLEEHPQSTITLLHVINPVSMFAYGDEEYFDLEGYQMEERRRRESAQDMLDDYRERATARGVDVETVIETGTPARRILEFAEEHDVDHVVMGSHGRTGMGRVLLGSVAEKVTRRSPVPVTIVR